MRLLISGLPRGSMTSQTSDACPLKGNSPISETVTTHARTQTGARAYTHTQNIFYYVLFYSYLNF